MALVYFNSAGQVAPTAVTTMSGYSHTLVWAIEVDKPILVSHIGWGAASGNQAPANPVIYDLATGAKIGTSAGATAMANWASAKLTNPVILEPGKAYGIGIYVAANNEFIYWRVSNSDLPGALDVTIDGVRIRNTERVRQTAGNNLPPAGSIGAKVALTMTFEPYNYPPSISTPTAELGDLITAPTISYTVTDYESRLAAIRIKINDVLTQTLSNPAVGSKSYTIPTDVFDALTLGDDHTVLLEVEDLNSQVASTPVTFRKIPPAQLSLLESVDVLNRAKDRAKRKMSQMAAMLGVDVAADLNGLIEGVRGSIKWAEGIVPGMIAPGKSYTVTGLDFTPDVIAVAFAYSTDTQYTHYIFGGKFPNTINGAAAWTYHTEGTVYLAIREPVNNSFDLYVPDYINTSQRAIRWVAFNYKGVSKL